MLPAQLKAEAFKNYPPLARQLATDSIELFQQLPLTFVALLLRELISYDWKFPAERKDMDRQLAYLGPLAQAQRKKLMAPFASLDINSQLEHFDWVNSPAVFSEQLTAHLWATHQMDAIHDAAEGYLHQLNVASPAEPPPVPRLGMAVIGKGVKENKYRLFRKLRPHGVYFNRIKPENGLRMLMEKVEARASVHPVPYGHWYIDGGTKENVNEQELACVAYDSLEPVRTNLLNKMEKAIQTGIGGPEALRTMMAKLRPDEVGLSDAPDRSVLNHFQVSVLTEGSGTQIFSTTFVQWTAREALRRAQPVTVLSRYAPRQLQRPMNELISGKQRSVEYDPEGSLIDADMGAYYTWLNQQRLSGAAQSSFLVWFEDHSEAVAISPTLPRGTHSDSEIDLKTLLNQLV